MSQHPTGELMMLWQQGTRGDPEPEEIARLAGRASIARFDRRIFWRNFREYAAGLVLLPVFAYEFAAGDGGLRAAVSFACVGFVMVYLWLQHRNLPDVDPAADARRFQASMLDRIDRQIRLLSTARYWYLLPLYVPPIWTSVMTWRRSPVAAVVGAVVVTAVYVFIGWLNERAGVRFLKKEREKIEALYRESL